VLASRGTSAGESDFSWTVDFADRRAKARDDMAPHLAEVEKRKLEAVGHKERLTALRRSNASDAVLATCRDALAAAEKAARDAQARAAAIDVAVYDLKAVNPRTHIVRDNRTSAEIIESIASHGRSVDSALARLKALLAGDPTPASGD
jgi:type I restriction enzyme M protein